MYRLSLRAVLALLLCAGYSSAQQPAYRLEVADVHKVNATITYEIKMKEFAARKWMMFMHEPPETPSQVGIKTKCSPAGEVVRDKSLIARKVRYIEVLVEKPTPGAGMKLKLDIEATLRSRKLVKLKPDENPPAVAALTEDERTYYLSPTTQIDFKAMAFQDWLDEKKLRLGKGESPIDFAERIMKVLRNDVTYHFDAYEDKRASVVCKSNKTDCAGMSFLVVGAMRTSGIPARVIVGRLTPSNRTNGTAVTSSDQPHVRAEVYVPNVGWVPCDPSFATGDKKNPVTHYIGNDPGDLLLLHVDVDLKLPFPDRVRESRFLQLDSMYRAEGDGRFDGSFGFAGWEFKSTPLTKK